MITKKLLIALFGLTFAVSSCQNKPSTTTTTNESGVQVTSKVITVEEYEKAITNPDIQLVDVRTPAEFSSGHIAKAININVMDATFTNEISKLDKQKPVYIYCRSGARSQRAAATLMQNGFTQIIDLQGGINSWNAAGKMVE